MATTTGEKIGTVNMGLFGYCSLQFVSSAQVVSQVKKVLDSSHLSPTVYLSSPASMNQDDIPSSQIPVVIDLALEDIPSCQTPVLIVLALAVVIDLALTCLGWMEEYD